MTDAEDTGAAESFATRLQEAIDEEGYSVRGLARKLVGADADEKRVESKRRTLQKYLAGQVPNRPQARELAAALNRPADYFVTQRPRAAASASARLEDQMVLALGNQAEVLRTLQSLSTAVDAQTALIRAQSDRLVALERLLARRRRSA